MKDSTAKHGCDNSFVLSVWEHRKKLVNVGPLTKKAIGAHVDGRLYFAPKQCCPLIFLALLDNG